jgi:hypothetical protein
MSWALFWALILLSIVLAMGSELYQTPHLKTIARWIFVGAILLIIIAYLF